MGLAALSDTSLAGADLTAANLWGATVTNADFTDARVAEADFGGTTTKGFTAAKLAGTASYKAHDLHGIRFGGGGSSQPGICGHNEIRYDGTGSACTIRACLSDAINVLSRRFW
jgi:uncharacterized protein YjbI with pentapeptide repeats